MLHVNDGRAGRFMPSAPLLLVLAALAAAADSPCSKKMQHDMASCRGMLMQQPNAAAFAAGSMHDQLRDFSNMSNELAAAFNISFDLVANFANYSSDTRLQHCLWAHSLQPFARASLSLQAFASYHHTLLVAGTTIPFPLNAGTIAARAAGLGPGRPDHKAESRWRGAQTGDSRAHLKGQIMCSKTCLLWKDVHLIRPFYSEPSF